MEATYAVVPSRRRVELRTETLDDQLAPNEILVQAEATVISTGTELANFTGVDPGVDQPGNWNTYPWRPGYGLVGRIVNAGSDFAALAEGDRVFCFAQHASLQMHRVAGIRVVAPVPETLPADHLAMMRMALVALTAPQVSSFQAGDVVAVFGLGLVGNLAAQLYQIAGARVVGFDLNPQRCDLARRTGLEEVYSVPLDEQLTVLRDLTQGAGAPVAVDAVGHSAVVAQCIRGCASHGDVILLGTPRAPHNIDVTPVFSDVHYRWLNVKGALEWRLPPMPGYGILRSTLNNIELMVSHLENGRLKLAPLISHVIQPGALQQAYLGLLEKSSEYWGVVIDWSHYH